MSDGAIDDEVVDGLEEGQKLVGSQGPAGNRRSHFVRFAEDAKADGEGD
jgi:hypothetical protein